MLRPFARTPNSAARRASLAATAHKDRSVKRYQDSLLFSASDLVAFQECPHVTSLDLVNLDTPLAPAEDDDHAKLVQRKGLEHEARYLATLEAAGLNVVNLKELRDLAGCTAATLAAMRAGADVIFQATLRSGRFFGHADFLRKVERPSALGDHSYEVADTKLARSTKARFLVQLSCYSDLLEHTQGIAPERMHVLLGSGEEKTFRCADYRQYVAKEGLNKPSKSRSAITSLAFGDTSTTKFGFSSAATRVSGRNVAFSGAAGATIPSSPTTVVEPSTDSTARTA